MSRCEQCSDTGFYSFRHANLGEIEVPCSGRCLAARIAELEDEVARLKSTRWAMHYLYIHGYLTDPEKARVKRRIRKIEVDDED